MNEDWGHPLPKSSSFRISSPTMPSSPSDFDIITPPKPVVKTYATVVATLVNQQVENIKKVYSEKMAKLDKDLSQEAKRHESKKR
jgi:hypothetical protein